MAEKDRTDHYEEMPKVKNTTMFAFTGAMVGILLVSTGAGVAVGAALGLVPDDDATDEMAAIHAVGLAGFAILGYIGGLFALVPVGRILEDHKRQMVNEWISSNYTPKER